MRPLLAALALVSLLACAPGTSTGHNPLGDVDANGIGGSVNGGDGGGDGGVDGDAGADAGCVPLTLNSAGAVDSCQGGAQAGTASVSVADAGNGCAAIITLTTGMTCNGTASGGTNDAFSGTCNAMPCISGSLPGTILCATGGTPCTIRICDAGVCAP
jgi:hypothetical protein